MKRSSNIPGAVLGVIASDKNQKRCVMTRLSAPGGLLASATLLICTLASAQQPPRPPAALPPLPLNGPLIKVAQGEAQGSLVDGVAVFRGLPFAAPPVGELRWRAPQPAAHWSGTRPANAFAKNCREAEDCLYLNVFRPEGATKLPVLLYLHGGGFVGGSGAMNGVPFARQGVVLVTSNYRLGRAGWFAHPALTNESPSGPLGNYGLMDQIATLQWIKDNIAAFGGDANNVTIAGGSAGAISVNYLMLAPQARGLFHKAISQSGFGRRSAQPLRGADGVEATGLAFAEKAGVKGSDAAAAKALRAMSWEALTANVAGVGQAGQPLPMADGKYITGSAFEGFAKALEARVPYMLGGNSDEASLTRRATNAAERFAAIKNGRDEFLAVFDPAKSGNADRIVARLITDQSISEPNRALARLHAKNGAPTYVYHFSYVPGTQRQTAFGMGHGAETAYVFKTPRGEEGFDAEGRAISEAASKYWAEFARTGDPGSAGGAKWPRFDATDETLLEFPAGGMPVARKHFDAPRLDWVEASLVK
jgi:para-nitrobenzyl esterase